MKGKHLKETNMWNEGKLTAILLLASFILFCTPRSTYISSKELKVVDTSACFYGSTQKSTVIEPTIQVPIEEEVIEPESPGLSHEEIDLIALTTMGEAEAESEEGKRMVIDVILNRLDSSRFPDTVRGVIYARNAFECMWNGRIERCYVRDDIRQLVLEELKSRTNSNVYYFRTSHYHNFGTPVVQVGNHYFSTY